MKREKDIDYGNNRHHTNNGLVLSRIDYDNYGNKEMIKPSSLKGKILIYLRLDKGWLHKGEIERLAKEWGYMGETSGRECRLLKELGLIEKEKYGKSQRYRAIVRRTVTYRKDDGTLVKIPQYS